MQLSIQPTDPSWQGKVPLQFRGLLRADYPAEGSLELTSEVSTALSREICCILNEILAAEVIATAKRYPFCRLADISDLHVYILSAKLNIFARGSLARIYFGID